MYTLLISIVALVLGYIFYGGFLARVFGPDKYRRTPAYEMADGIDYVPMPTWKVFMIQFLNIAGTGPIFGAILGAKFGPACYLWIVLGCVFGGAMHDYISGMISLRNGGESLPNIIGRYLGGTTKSVMLFFAIVLMLLVGAVFVYSPAEILGNLTGLSAMIWVVVLILYYLVATVVPIDKIIGKIYPVFGFALLFMAVSLLICLFAKWPSGMPELWDGLANRDPSSGPIFPCLFISIACGAISGFHATQSPLMARCIKNEKLGKPIYYGSMISEGVVALIWAAIGTYFFYDGGAQAIGTGINVGAPTIVTAVSTSWLGKFGGILAMLGVVAAPITSGDTALRSARLMIADTLKMDQKPVRNRFVLAIPIFATVLLLLWFNISNPQGFNVIWRYFGWTNQTLAVFTLWAITAFFVKEKNGLYYMISLIPAAFMTAVSVTFISINRIGFNVPEVYAPYIGLGTFVVSVALFHYLKSRKK